MIEYRAASSTRPGNTNRSVSNIFIRGASCVKLCCVTYRDVENEWPGENVGKVWAEKEIELFINIWNTKEMSKLDGISKNIALFRKIVNKMAEKGFTRTIKEVKSMMKSLKADYCKVIDHNKLLRSGDEPKQMLFQDDLKVILGDRPSVQPKFVMEAGASNLPEHLTAESEPHKETESISDNDETTQRTKEPTKESKEEKEEKKEQKDTCNTWVEFEVTLEPTSVDNETTRRTKQSTKGSKKRRVLKKRSYYRQRMKEKRQKEIILVVEELFKKREMREKSLLEERRKYWEERQKRDNEWREQIHKQHQELIKVMNTAVNLCKTMFNAQASEAHGAQMFLNGSGHLPLHTTHALLYPGHQPQETPYQQGGYQ